MTVFCDFLLNRVSEPRLQAPAPDRETLDRAFACAARAPDHALLRPWRYLVVEGEGLEALGDLFASTCPNNSDERQIEKLRKSPLRAPMVIVAIASPTAHPKVPEVEQIMSAAAGVSFLELALQDAGYGVMWRTGSVAYHSVVRSGLGLAEGESVVAFLYTGTVSSEKPPVPRPEVSDFVQRWPG
ncbi:nitroreductase family protein [Marinobacter sediminum]|uniref:nitroreductase family protein n=1 Tax=Marinobacter sediminum TaxID=256323 RepID=UPI00203014D7|nr:nitroreductase family protein [Marinobacter sediminum]MCM0612291.1 nitroreductase family protein [Marinobacter sediminum]